MDRSERSEWWLRDRCHRYPIPTHEEQILLGRRIRRWQDWPGGPDQAPERVRRAGLAARERLVTGNMRLVFTELRRYMNSPNWRVEVADLEQSAMFGLMRAAEKFDPERGYAFSTYARSWIQQAISRSMPEILGPIRVPWTTRNVVVRARGVASELKERLGRMPTYEEISGELKGTMRRSAASLRDLHGAYAQAESPMSLQELVGRDGTGSMVVDLIPSDEPDPIEVVIADETKERVDHALALCSERDVDILRRRLGGQTYGEIGKRYGLGREAARRVCERVRDQVQTVLAEDFVKIEMAA